MVFNVVLLRQIVVHFAAAAAAAFHGFPKSKTSQLPIDVILKLIVHVILKLIVHVSINEAACSAEPRGDTDDSTANNRYERVAVPYTSVFKIAKCRWDSVSYLRGMGNVHARFRRFCCAEAKKKKKKSRAGLASIVA